MDLNQIFHLQILNLVDLLNPNLPNCVSVPTPIFLDDMNKATLLELNSAF